jgi:integrase
MATTYKVQIWQLDKYAGVRGTRYIVRWAVEGRHRKSRYATKALAEVFRAELLSAQRQGVAFDVATGLPVTKLRDEAERMNWYEFACSYVDMKWQAISPKHRKGIAEVLTTATIAQLTELVDPDEARRLRSALLNWGFNRRRGSAEQPGEVTSQLEWVSRHSRAVADFARPEVIRAVLEAGATKVDGTRASGRTATWKRSVVSTALKHAVERGLLEANPVGSISWQAPRTSQVVDRRSVINPSQARVLLEAVRRTPRSGPMLVAFFAVMYYSALRPEEASNLRRRNLELPADGGWGWITLETSTAEVDRHWTDSGKRRDERELKHRAVGDVRRVPCPPPLTVVLQAHLTDFGTDAEGRLFRGERGGHLAGVTYNRLWARARAAALTPERIASPLARRSYDLRHAAVSTWLTGGVAPSQVAEWAGHSVEVLLRVYAKCLDGGEGLALQRIASALDDQSTV